MPDAITLAGAGANHRIPVDQLDGLSCRLGWPTYLQKRVCMHHFFAHRPVEMCLDQHQAGDWSRRIILIDRYMAIACHPNSASMAKKPRT